MPAAGLHVREPERLASLRSYQALHSPADPAIDAAVSTLLYSPCDVRVANTLSFGGQIYTGGRLTFDNAVNLEYRPMPVPGQPSSGGGSTTYSLQVTGKRENS